jgi:hypothetical protein
MSVPHPRDCRHSTENDSHVGDNACDENSIMLNVHMPEHIHDFVDEPYDGRERASAMNTTKML